MNSLLFVKILFLGKYVAFKDRKKDIVMIKTVKYYLTLNIRPTFYNFGQHKMGLAESYFPCPRLLPYVSQKIVMKP